MLSIPEAVALLQQERPTLIPALRSALDEANTNPAFRAQLNVILLELLDMQSKLNHKRTLGRQMLVLRGGLGPVGTVNGQSYAMRHIPDVMIRKLCDIGELPHITTASAEWLDEMEAKNAVR